MTSTTLPSPDAKTDGPGPTPQPFTSTAPPATRPHAQEAASIDADVVTAVLETRPDRLAILDEEGVLLFANAAWRSPLGPDERLAHVARGRSLLSTLDRAEGAGARDLHALAAALREVLEGRSEKAERELAASGLRGERWFRVRGVRVSKSPVRLLVAVEDISVERKAEDAQAALLRHELELRQRREELRVQERVVDALALEMNTPLTVVRLQLHLLQMQGSLSPQAKRSLGLLSRNLERSMAAQRRLVDAVALHHDQVQFPRQSFDLAELVDRAVQPYRTAALRAGIRLAVGTDGAALPVAADAARLEEVVSNLLDNALRFTPAGGHIQVRVARTDGHASFSVTDDGAGIDRARIESIFKPFAGRPEPPTEGEHTGLGLFLSRQIVEAQGGQLAAASDGAGHGATFAFILPLEDTGARAVRRRRAGGGSDDAATGSTLSGRRAADATDPARDSAGAGGEARGDPGASGRIRPQRRHKP